MHEAISILEDGLRRFPGTADLLELLIAGLLHVGDDSRLHTALTELEEVAPNSAALDVVRSLDDNDAREFSRNLTDRTFRLLESIQNADPSIRDAAIQELSRIVKNYPSNVIYRLNYAFALGISGQKEGALSEARKLENIRDMGHSFHFNLGQVLWNCGDPAQGRVHLDLAIQYGESEEERQDAANLIEYLEQRQ